MVSEDLFKFNFHMDKTAHPRIFFNRVRDQETRGPRLIRGSSGRSFDLESAMKNFMLNLKFQSLDLMHSDLQTVAASLKRVDTGL